MTPAMMINTIIDVKVQAVRSILSRNVVFASAMPSAISRLIAPARPDASSMSW